MAEVKIVNEVPAVTTNDNFFMWRAVNEMMNAGWLFVGSSNGTTMSLVSSNWGTYAGSADQANAWICLQRPGGSGDGYVFWRRNVISINQSQTPSCVLKKTLDGWNTSGASASTPPVATTQDYYLRGNSSNGGAWWFGSNSGQAAVTVSRMNFIIRDPASDGTLAFYGFNAAGTFVHCFLALRLAPATVHGAIGDPFAYCLGATNSNWTSGPSPGLSAIQTWKVIPRTPGATMNSAASTLVRRIDNGDVLVDKFATYKDRFINSTTVYGELIGIIDTTDNCYKGWMLDGPYVGTGAVGDTYGPDTSHRNYVMCVGDFIKLPWDGTTTTLLTT